MNTNKLALTICYITLTNHLICHTNHTNVKNDKFLHESKLCLLTDMEEPLYVERDDGEVQIAWRISLCSLQCYTAQHNNHILNMVPAK